MHQLDWGLGAIWAGFNVWMLYRAVLLKRSFTVYLDQFEEK
jgi:hypothetical protein